jgi:hypothetical protein
MLADVTAVVHISRAYMHGCLYNQRSKKMENDVLFTSENYECVIEFFEWDNEDIGITIEDNVTGRVLDFFVNRAALLAALNK